jgi:hypothetical protein
MFFMGGLGFCGGETLVELGEALDDFRVLVRKVGALTGIVPQIMEESREAYRGRARPQVVLGPFL